MHPLRRRSYHSSFEPPPGFKLKVLFFHSNGPTYTAQASILRVLVRSFATPTRPFRNRSPRAINRGAATQGYVQWVSSDSTLLSCSQPNLRSADAIKVEPVLECPTWAILLIGFAGLNFMASQSRRWARVNSISLRLGSVGLNGSNLCWLSGAVLLAASIVLALLFQGRPWFHGAIAWTAVIPADPGRSGVGGVDLRGEKTRTHMRCNCTHPSA
jgi:hypothetical protein